MVWRFSTPAFLLLAMILLPAWTVVYKSEQKKDLLANLTDQERMALYVEEHWSVKFLPFFLENAHDYGAVDAAVAAEDDAKLEKFGLRPEGEGNAWSFVVKGTGVILSANVKSRAAKAQVDINDDGEADFILQLGPVIKGTTLRDAAVFLKFSDFRDQIEYAKLGGALNAQIHGDTISNLPMETLDGAKIRYVAAFTLRSKSKKLPLLTPIQVGVVK